MDPDPVPDPADHFYADPDADPYSDFFMPMRIQVTRMIGIHADPDAERSRIHNTTLKSGQDPYPHESALVWLSGFALKAMRIHNTAFTLVAGQVFSTGGGSGQGHPSTAATATMNGGGRGGGGETKPSITPLNRQQITEVGCFLHHIHP